MNDIVWIFVSVVLSFIINVMWTKWNKQKND